MNVTERFLKYVSFDTSSDPDSGLHPSSEKQLLLGRHLADELAAMGLRDVHMTEQGYVYGVLPASEGCEQAASIGLIAHMDTSPDVSGADVKPRIVEYSGGDIVLDEKNGIIMRQSEFEHMSDYIGKRLIVTDGATLLGADDKAGIAEIFTALERIVGDSSIKHGRIPVCVTPDEEIGEGADSFDVAGFAADYAYTVDGGALGELEYENFNAASAIVNVNGVNIHPGEGKNKMKNAALIAVDLAGMLPAAQTPACTEKYEGFYHLTDISGNEEKARLRYIIRDHDREKFEQKKQLMRCIVDYINTKYGGITADLEMRDSYYNMREIVEKRMDIIDKAADAMRKNGVEPKIIPIRGGTDGARLSYMGLPCPNLSTGGHNFHGRFEYIPVESMEKMTDVIVDLVSC